MLPEIYIPNSLIGFADELVVAGHVRPDGLMKPVAAQIYAIDPEQPVMDVRTIESVLGDYVYAEPRFNLFLLGMFAVLGLALALFGVYGVISNTVTQHTRESYSPPASSQPSGPQDAPPA